MKLLPITLLAAFLPIIPLEAASIDFTGIYTQDFDALPPKAFTVTGNQATELRGLPGWQLYNFGEKRNAKYCARDNGSTLYSGFFSYARGPEIHDRALGAMTNNSKVSPVFGLILRNHTGKVIDTLQISYLGQQWGMTNTGHSKGKKPSANTLYLSYKLSVEEPDISGMVGDPSYRRAGAPFDITAPTLAHNAGDNKPTPVDGTLPQNQIPVKGTLQNLNWQPGQYLILRWELPWKRYAENALAINHLLIQSN